MCPGMEQNWSNVRESSKLIEDTLDVCIVGGWHKSVRRAVAYGCTEKTLVISAISKELYTIL